MDAPKPVPIFRAKVDEHGRLQALEAGRFAGYMARLRGKVVEVTVRPERKHRSLNANRYYWGVVVAAAAEWSGHEPEEMHEVWKALFLPRVQVLLPTGELVDRPGSTTELDTEQFSDFVNKAIRWLGEQGVPVPASSEVA